MIRFAMISLLVVSSAFSATITVSNVNLSGNTNGIGDSLGNLYTDGSGYVGIGVFTGLTDGEIQTISSSTNLENAFTLFGTSSTIGPSFNIDGTFQFNTTGAIAGAPFAGENVFLVIGDAASLGGSSEFIVYKYTETFVADPGATDLPLLSGTAGGSLLIGSFGLPQNDINGAADTFRAAALIPEPSAALLGGLGALLLLRRRRNKA